MEKRTADKVIKQASSNYIQKNQQALWILLFFIAIAVVGLWGTRQLLLENAKVMGSDLVKSYAMDEEMHIASYENMLTLGMSYLEDKIEAEESIEQIDAWLVDFFEKSCELVGSDMIDAYAVVGGKIITSKPWPGIETYDAKDTLWYEEAMNSGGRVIFTEAYTDTAYGMQVVTIAKANPETGDAMAYDLFPGDFNVNHQHQTLLEDGSYYVCDANGTLLYYDIPTYIEKERVEEYIKSLHGQIQDGTLNEEENWVSGILSDDRGVYYYQMPNGWLCILSLPYTLLLQGVESIYLWYGVIFTLFVLVAGYMWYRDRNLSQYAETASETIKALGNSYYAIYRIHVNVGTYEMTKESEPVRSKLPYKGNYIDLLHLLSSVMDEETRIDFENSFSLDNIKILVKQGTKDFGGDFLRKFQGQVRWVNVRLLLDPALGPREAVLCFREVEEEKQRWLRHVKLTEDALADAEASERSQRQFFSNMSHDMRTPLNAIIGLSDLALQSDYSPEKYEDCFEKIRLSSKQLLVLINDILEISRLDHGIVDMYDQAFNIGDVVSECVSTFKSQALREGKELVFETDVKAQMVIGDAFRLTQILNNILSNAFKFTRRGDSVKVSLWRQGTGDNSVYSFEIEDTGIGMSQDFLPKLFEPYEREKRFEANTIEGTGLGMPIVKRLVSQMEGQIMVHSFLGTGTKFIVTLPFVTSKSTVSNAGPNDYEAKPVSLSGKCIMLVEDHCLNMEIATEILENCGARVIGLENGEQALIQFSESEPYFFDAILMDIQMPVMDGCETAEAIRRLDRPDGKTVPIIALTANAFSEDIARAMEAGMNAHLSKPVDGQLLSKTLASILYHRKGA